MLSSNKGGSPFALDSLFSLNINDQAFRAEFIRAFPNPVSDILTIDSNVSGDEEINLRLYNSFGSVIYKTVFRHSTQISFQSFGFSSGLYILVFESDSYRKEQKIIYNP